MTNYTRILGIAAGAALGLSAFAVQAQSTPNATGYLESQRSDVVRSGTNLCWRTQFWTPAMAIAECDPDMVKKPEPPKPVAAPKPPPPPPPPPPPAPKTLTVTAVDLFAFNDAKLDDKAKRVLDTEVIAKLSGFRSIKVVIVGGHTDRIGTQRYNQALSEKRARAVGEYLFSKGVSAALLEITGFGKTVPAKLGCDDKLPKKQLHECLAPNRRVTIEVVGTAK